MSDTFSDVFSSLPTPEEGNATGAPASVETPEFTADDIHAEIVGTGENGYSRCAISATLEILHEPGKNAAEELDETNCEFVRTMDVLYSMVDIYSIDGDIVNVIFTFDSANDVFVRELRDISNSYRAIYEKSEELANANKTEDYSVPQLSFVFMPYKYQGFASATFANPVAWFVTVAEESGKGQLHLLFHMEDVSYNALEIDEDTRADILAEAQRELSAKVNTEFY